MILLKFRQGPMNIDLSTPKDVRITPDGRIITDQLIYRPTGKVVIEFVMFGERQTTT